MNDSLLYNDIENTDIRVSTEINNKDVSTNDGNGNNDIESVIERVDSYDDVALSNSNSNSPNSQTNTNISDQSNKNENILCCLKFTCKYFCNPVYWLSFIIFAGIIIIVWVIIDAVMITK
jgi:hypothetical protein